MLNEIDTDFRVPGLPHSVVKQAENYRIRELVKKIENHPHREFFNEICVGEDIVKADEGPVSGVAQVACHGVKVVGVHGEEGREEDGEM